MITYAAQPLLLGDADGEVQDWLDHYLPTDAALCFSDWNRRSLNRYSSRAGHATPVGLGIPNYPDPPRPRINQLYWPTGASRWAYGFFLCTEETKEVIERAVRSGSSDTSSDLVMSVTDSVTITTKMHLLAPRPISCIAGDSDDIKKTKLWLLPLVDVRYYWQFRNPGDLAVTSSTTWSSLISTIGGLLGTSVSTSTIDSDYLRPDPEELTRRYENSAVLLDAIAHSIGQRITRQLDGTVKSVDADESDDAMDDNDDLDWQQITGDDFDGGPIPAKVRVVCRKYTNHRPYGDGSVKTYDNTVTGSAEQATTASTIKTIYTTCYADYTTGGGSPDNDTKLSDLAAKIQEDYEAWQTRRYDKTFVGLLEWNLTGYCDHVLWSVGCQGADGGYDCQTRVQSVPANFGVEEMLHQDPDLEVIEAVQIGKCTSPITKGSSGDMVVWSKSSGSWASTSNIIEIDALGAAIAVGKYVAAQFIGTAWVGVPMECS